MERMYIQLVYSSRVLFFLLVEDIRVFYHQTGLVASLIHLKDSYWQPIHREIQNFLWSNLFDELFTVLAIKKPFQNAKVSHL